MLLRHVRLVPNSDIAYGLFDHLVGPQKEWNRLVTRGARQHELGMPLEC